MKSKISGISMFPVTNYIANICSSWVQFSYHMISGQQEKIKSNHPNMIYFLLSLQLISYQTVKSRPKINVWKINSNQWQ